MITTVGKIKILAYLRTNNLQYGELTKIANTGKGNVSGNDLLNFFYKEIDNYFNGKVVYNEDALMDLFNGLDCSIKGSREAHRDIIDKIYLLSDHYEACVSNGTILYSEEVKKFIDTIINDIGKCYTATKEEDLSVYVEEVKKLKSKIEILNKKLEEEKNKSKELSSSLKKIEKDSSKKDGSLEEYKINLSKKDKDIEVLEEKISYLTNKIEELKAINSTDKTTIAMRDTTIGKLNDEIKLFEDKLNELGTKNSELNSRIQELEVEIAKYKGMVEGYNTRDKIIEEDKRLYDFIFDTMLSGQYTMSELLKICENNGFGISRDLLYSKLMEIDKELRIVDRSSISLPIVYGVKKPYIITNSKLNIEASKCLDIVAISDLHIKNHDVATNSSKNDLVKKMDAVYDYASVVGASCILDLGDLFHLWDAKELNTADGYRDLKELIERVSNTLPRCDSINHLILGGNHDKSLLRFGIDPMVELSKYRDDCISLGYDIGSICVNGCDNIVLHHFNSGKFEEPLVIGTIGYGEIGNYIKTDNTRYGINNVYCDLLGHIHASYIDTGRGIVTLPSLTSDRVSNGAMHIKIYLNENGSIKHIVFIPLVLTGKKLNKVSEISYQKMLTK